MRFLIVLAAYIRDKKQKLFLCDVLKYRNYVFFPISRMVGREKNSLLS